MPESGQLSHWLSQSYTKQTENPQTSSSHPNKDGHVFTPFSPFSDRYVTLPLQNWCSFGMSPNAGARVWVCFRTSTVFVRSRNKKRYHQNKQMDGGSHGVKTSSDMCVRVEWHESERMDYELGNWRCALAQLAGLKMEWVCRFNSNATGRIYFWKMDLLCQKRSGSGFYLQVLRWRTPQGVFPANIA